MVTVNRQDKYKAVWLSHSSIGDYEKCPRLYYLHDVYKDPKTKRKINITSPYMSLGIAIHNVVEDLKNYKVDDRKKILTEKNIILNQEKLLENFEIEFAKVSGKKGGFTSEEQEKEFKNRGVKMVQNVIADPKLLLNKTVSTKSYYTGDMLPNFYISQEENIILCGNIDWIEYNEPEKIPLNPLFQKEGRGTISVVDFKTGKNEEKENSMQLPIYKILLESLQNKWKVVNGKYWYLESGVVITKEIDEDKIKQVKEKIIKIGVEIRDKKLTWSGSDWLWNENFENNFACKNGKEGCLHCKSYEKILAGEAEYLGVDMYKKDLYFI